MDTKQELFTYSPWDLTWEDYWAIAKERLKIGQNFPVYYYGYAADFASKHYSILTEGIKWNKCYETRYTRLAFVYHKWVYNNPPKWYIDKKNELSSS